MSYEQQREHIFQTIGNFSCEGFEAAALEVFQFQAAFNPLYARYISLLNVDVQQVKRLEQVPFLPIRFFKNYAVKTGEWAEDTRFTSSGTTGSDTATHYVRDLDFYKKNTVSGFRQRYGDPADYLVLALLPAYLERSGSSLVCMAEHFIRLSRRAGSGFFLNNLDRLAQVLTARDRSRPTLLLGVSFALLDLATLYPLDLQEVVFMETGGMKGRRREMTREELHKTLQNAFRTDRIHSEYGMTELLSQAYSSGGGKFLPAPTLRAFARDITDPLCLLPAGKTGALNLVDLANFDTCSFLATDDLGRVWEDGAFEVLGRLDESDVRGCNLLYM